MASENPQPLTGLSVPSEQIPSSLCSQLPCNQPQAPGGEPQFRGPWDLPGAALSQGLEDGPGPSPQARATSWAAGKEVPCYIVICKTYIFGH